MCAFSSRKIQRIIKTALYCPILGGSMEMVQASEQQDDDHHYFITLPEHIVHHLKCEKQDIAGMKLNYTPGEDARLFLVCKKGLIADCGTRGGTLIENLTVSGQSYANKGKLKIYLSVILDENQERKEVLKETISFLEGLQMEKELHFFVLDPRFQNLDASKRSLYRYLQEGGMEDISLVERMMMTFSLGDECTFPLFQEDACIFDVDDLRPILSDIGFHLDERNAFSAEGEEVKEVLADQKAILCRNQRLIAVFLGFFFAIFAQFLNKFFLQVGVFSVTAPRYES